VLLLLGELRGRGHCTEGSPGLPLRCLLSCPGSGVGGRSSTVQLSPLGAPCPALGLVPAHTLHLVATLVLLTAALVRTPSARLAGAVDRLSRPQPAQAWLGALPRLRGLSPSAFTESGCARRRGSTRERLSWRRAWCHRQGHRGGGVVCPSKREPHLRGGPGRAELPWARQREPRVDVLPCAWRRSCCDPWRGHCGPHPVGVAGMWPDAGSGTA